jgi:hypothetical protein
MSMMRASVSRPGETTTLSASNKHSTTAQAGDRPNKLFVDFYHDGRWPLRGHPEGPEALSARCSTVETEVIAEVPFAIRTMQAVQESWCGTGYPAGPACDWGVDFYHDGSVL